MRSFDNGMEQLYFFRIYCTGQSKVVNLLTALYILTNSLVQNASNQSQIAAKPTLYGVTSYFTGGTGDKTSETASHIVKIDQDTGDITDVMEVLLYAGSRFVHKKDNRLILILMKCILLRIIISY